MSPSHPDSADLTAYALGELPLEQERQMREWIAANPEAQAGLARIESISEALHHGAPIPALKLTPQQRQNVLAPPKGPRIFTPMMPRQPVAKVRSRFSPFLASVTRIAAALAVAGIAFVLGRHAGTPSPEVAEVANPSSTEGKINASPAAALPAKMEKPAAAAAVGDRPMAAAAPAARPAAGAAPIIPPPAESVAAQPETAAPATTVAGTQAVPPAPLPASPPAARKPSPSPTAPGPAAPVAQAVAAAPRPEAAKPSPGTIPASDLRGYAVASRDPISKVTLRPHETRPAPVKPVKGEALASPVSPNAAPVPPDKAPARAPEFAIQSWKAEVASCPWNPGHKLMRVLVQAPADQLAAASASNTYPLQVKFDEIAVRSYRLLSESHVAPHPGASNAAHVMWYEVIPNRGAPDASRDAGRSVATISVGNARFDSQAVGPFDGKDSRTLHALDSGVKWENAREDFLFETAIVGFGLLLRGEENLGSLNHELVLKLAEHAKGDKEVDGERAKFIRLVREARRMTGI